MGFEHVLVERPGGFVTVTMNWPERRKALSPQHIPHSIPAATRRPARP